MWPDSEFAKPVSSFQRPVPLVLVNPDSEPYLYFRFNKAWLPYVLGALKQLMLQTTWDTNNPDTLNLQQMQAGQILYEFSIASGNLWCKPDGYEIDMSSVCEALRWHDGKLQGLCCGEWTDIVGQDGALLGGPEQHGEGAPQPQPGGGCQTYHAQFAANSQYLVPTIVNAGDVVTFSNAKGAGHDGAVGVWNCPNGQTFFGNACVGVGGPQTGDPATAVDHMALVAKIGATWYPAFSGAVTVPGGVSNAQIVIQANDTPLSDNSGSYALDVEVCNNAATMWTHTFNFALADAGATKPIHAGWTPDTWGVWTVGTGFVSAASVASGTTQHVMNFKITFPHTTINTAVMNYSLAKGTFLTGLDNWLFLQRSGADVIGVSRPAATDPDGSANHFDIPAGSYDADTIDMMVRDAYYVTGSNGTSVIYQLVLTGPGTDPF